MDTTFLDALKLVLDVTGIFACGLGVLLLVRRVGTPQPRGAAVLPAVPNAGVDAGFLRLVKQTEMAFGTISKALRQEHRMLQTLLDDPATEGGRGTAPPQARPSAPGAPVPPSGAAGKLDPYAAAQRLAERGLGPREIEKRPATGR